MLQGGPGGDRGAVYRLYNPNGVLLYVGITRNFGRRWRDHARDKPWWDEVNRMSVSWCSSWDEASQVEQAAIAAEAPVYNIAGVPAGRLHALELTRLIRTGGVPGDDEILAGMLLELDRTLSQYLSRPYQPRHRSASQADHPDQGCGPADHRAGIDPRRRRMRQLLATFGPDGCQVHWLRARLRSESIFVARETLQRWLAADEALGLSRRTGPPANRWTWTGVQEE